ncbi:hypothetical protein [Aquibacillus kalidii]|uniref:hypothetical protein n=1 Tax=Aquibacillus kalidii TaxID=2762597 RepID=UPI0016445C18|nr:hypothetical protein [Aquibacillus kalidii]
MLKSVDVGLMANHQMAHKAVISRLELYLGNLENPQLSTIITQQIQMMKNHMQVMNQLLEPNQIQVTLPPLPPGMPKLNVNVAQMSMEEKDIAMDAHFTASSMAKENFNSSENMKDKQVKQLHSQMGIQQSTIAEKYESFMVQMGWMSAPEATIAEQKAAMMPVNPVQNQAFMNQQQMNQQQSNPNQIN